jgi:hypothetical protein
MRQRQFSSLITLLLFIFLIAAPGLTLQITANPDETAVQTAAAQDQQKEQEEQQDKGKKKGDDFGEVLADRLSEGDTLFDALGISDLMPTTFEIFLLWLIPFTALVGIVALIVVLTKRRHERILAMIEKGDYQKGSGITYKPWNIRWDMVLSLTGLVLILGGVGLSLFLIGQHGIQKWHMGVIPVFVGIACLIFIRVFYRKKEDT